MFKLNKNIQKVKVYRSVKLDGCLKNFAQNPRLKKILVSRKSTVSEIGSSRVGRGGAVGFDCTVQETVPENG